MAILWLVGGEVIKSASLTSWFQLVWDLHAYKPHAVNFFLLVEVSVSAKQLKDVAQDIICNPRGGAKGSRFCWMSVLFSLFFVPAFSHFDWICFLKLGDKFEAKVFLQTRQVEDLDGGSFLGRFVSHNYLCCDNNGYHGALAVHTPSPHTYRGLTYLHCLECSYQSPREVLSPVYRWGRVFLFPLPVIMLPHSHAKDLVWIWQVKV